MPTPGTVIESTISDERQAFKLVRLLGEGGFGQVWLAHNSEGEARALKFLHSGQADAVAVELDNHVKAQRAVSSVNIPEFYSSFLARISYKPEGNAPLCERSHPMVAQPAQNLGSCDLCNEQIDRGQEVSLCVGCDYWVCLRCSPRVLSAQQSEFIVVEMEYLDGKSLGDILKKMDCPIPEFVTKVVLHDVVVALRQLHKHGVLHLDLKPDNIIISSSGLVYLVDFGLSAALADHERHEGKITKLKRNCCGTPGYMAPEMFMQVYNEKVDIWSLGMTAIHLVLGEVPQPRIKTAFDQDRWYELTQQMVLEDKAPQVTDEQLAEIGYSSQFQKFIRRTLKKDDQQRSSAAELLQSAYMVLGAEREQLRDWLQELAAQQLKRGHTDWRLANPRCMVDR